MATQVIPIQTLNRLNKEYRDLVKVPLPLITAHPIENNILEWRFVIKGPPDSDYKGGIYQGKLIFPIDFPYKPPAIWMLTPSGRFETKAKIETDKSDYHTERWSPLCTVSSVLNGLLTLMLSEEKAMGCVISKDVSKDKRKRLAKESWSFNLKDEVFCKLFPELAKEAKTKEQ